MKASALEDELAFQIGAYGLPVPERQYPWGESWGRKWVIDFAWRAPAPTFRALAVEVDGGVLTQGRHVRGLGREGDMVKDAALICAGWRVLRVSETMVRGGWAVKWIAAALHPERRLDPRDFPMPEILRKTRVAARKRRR